MMAQMCHVTMSARMPNVRSAHAELVDVAHNCMASFLTIRVKVRKLKSEHLVRTSSLGREHGPCSLPSVPDDCKKCMQRGPPLKSEAGTAPQLYKLSCERAAQAVIPRTVV